MKIRIKKTGKGQVLQVNIAGKWHNISTNEHFPPRERRDIHLKKFKRNNVKRKLEHKVPTTQVGMSGGDRTSINLTNRVSFLTGTASLRRDFQLPMGYEGQEKILVVKNYSTGNNVKVFVKTHQNDNTIYTANKKGQVLHFVCDGTYWYLVSTRYSTGGNEPGEWTTN
jgi:hypothetical protein